MLTGHASHQVGLDADVWLTPMPNRRLTEKEREELSATSMLAADRVSVNPEVWTDAHVRLLKRVASYKQVERVLVHPAIKKAVCTSAAAKEKDRAWLSKVRPDLGALLPLPYPHRLSEGQHQLRGPAAGRTPRMGAAPSSTAGLRWSRTRPSLPGPPATGEGADHARQLPADCSTVLAEDRGACASVLPSRRTPAGKKATGHEVAALLLPHCPVGMSRQTWGMRRAGRHRRGAMTILITGATGLIGRALTQSLRRQRPAAARGHAAPASRTRDVRQPRHGLRVASAHRAASRACARRRGARHPSHGRAAVRSAHARQAGAHRRLAPHRHQAPGRGAGPHARAPDRRVEHCGVRLRRGAAAHRNDGRAKAEGQAGAGAARLRGGCRSSARERLDRHPGPARPRDRAGCFPRAAARSVRSARDLAQGSPRRRHSGHRPRRRRLRC